MTRRRKHRKPQRDWAALEAKARDQLDHNRRRLEHATRNGTPQDTRYGNTTGNRRRL